jgi:hypothetical protein
LTQTSRDLKFCSGIFISFEEIHNILAQILALPQGFLPYAGNMNEEQESDATTTMTIIAPLFV